MGISRFEGPSVISRIAALALVLLSAADANSLQTDDCIASEGRIDQSERAPLLALHEGQTFLLGIARELIAAPFMWSTRVESASRGAGFNGMPIADRMIFFELVGKQVGVRIDDSFRVGTGTARVAAESVGKPALHAMLDIAREDHDRIWITVNPLLLNFGPASGRTEWWRTYLGMLSPPRVDNSLSQVLQAIQRSRSAQFRSELSITPTPTIPKSAESTPANSAGNGLGTPSNLSVMALHGFYPLPDQPMERRRMGPQAGYLSVEKQEYADGYAGPTTVLYMTRYNLKQSCSRKLSHQSTKPITFYIAPEVPDSWRAAIKLGVRSWAPLFEAAGYPGAIDVTETPPEPNWNPADPTYNTIRWVAQPISNATGIPTIDPRSGEILSSTIILWAGLLDHFDDLYRVSVGDADPRNTSQTNEERSQEILSYLVAHEVGHALGLTHNHKAATAYPNSWLRNKTLTDKLGTSASIMSYGRFNFVALRRDGLSTFVPKLGPYDYYAIALGYGSGASAAGELPSEMRALLGPLLPRSLEYSGDEDFDTLAPDVAEEVLGDDAVEAARSGLDRLRWTWHYVENQPVHSLQDIDRLRRLFRAGISLQTNLLRRTVKDIGGSVQSRYPTGIGVSGAETIEQEKQMASLRYVLEVIVDDHRNHEIENSTRRFQSGYAGAVLAESYKSIIADMLLPVRLASVHSASSNKLNLTQLLSKIQLALFSAPRGGRISAIRQDLQAAYLLQLRKFMSEPIVIPSTRAKLPLGSPPSRFLDVGPHARASARRLIQLCRILSRTQAAHEQPYYAAIADELSSRLGSVH